MYIHRAYEIDQGMVVDKPAAGAAEDEDFADDEDDKGIHPPCSYIHTYKHTYKHSYVSVRVPIVVFYDLTCRINISGLKSGGGTSGNLTSALEKAKQLASSLQGGATPTQIVSTGPTGRHSHTYIYT